MSPTILVWGRSSAGRASPLQGEGQEFESPRLHHRRHRLPYITHNEGPVAGPGPMSKGSGPSHRVSSSSDPCASRSPPTSATLGRPPAGETPPLRRRTFTSGYPIGNRNDEFAVIKGVIPNKLQASDPWVRSRGGQATKGTGWMPWRQEPMKDVAGCEQPRGVASRR